MSLNGIEQVISVSGGSDLEGTGAILTDFNSTDQVQNWFRSEVDNNGCFFLRNTNSGKLFTLDTLSSRRLLTIDQGDTLGNFSAVVRIEKKSNVINNELSCFGPHVHPSGSSGIEFKIYQPYDGPSIRKSNIKEMIFFLHYCNSLN